MSVLDGHNAACGYPMPMTADEQREEASSAAWQRILVDGHKPMKAMRGAFRAMPSAPRCKVCQSPFGGLGGKMFGLAGFRPSRKNPALCARCCEGLPPGGAVVDVAVLFADVRASTTLGEKLSAGEFARRMNRFYSIATGVLVSHDAVIDKLIGDEVMALFLRGMAGPGYREKAVAAGEALLRAAAREDPSVRLPLGVAVHAGPAFVGNVGSAAVVDFTALGDTVNTAARLQGEAQAGVLVVSEGIWESAGRPAGMEARTLSLRGREESVRVRVKTVA